MGKANISRQALIEAIATLEARREPAGEDDSRRAIDTALLALREKLAAQMAHEPDETFGVNLSAAVGASLADAQGLGTILGDDQPNPVPVNDPRALLLLIALMLSLAGLSLARRR